MDSSSSFSFLIKFIHFCNLDETKQIQCWQAALRTTLNPFFSIKFWSKCKSRDSFEFCLFWGFQNTPTCWNWSSFARVIWGQRQMISFSKLPVKWYNWENFLLKLTFCHKNCCVHLETFQNKEKNIFEMPVRCLGCLISWFWVKMSRILEISS